MRYQCPICGYIYDEEAGIPDAGIAPGTKWGDLPDDWSCPLCGAPKDSFEPVIETPAQTPAAQSSASKASASPSDPVARVANAPANTAEATDLHEFSAAELSVICSSLARACKQQYLHEQSEGFAKLGDYFKAKVEPADESDLAGLIELIDTDLGSGFPAASDAAASAFDRGARRPLGWAEKVTRMERSLIERYEKEGAAMLDDTNVWVCTACGFIFIGEKPPEICPVCKVPAFKFDKIGRR